MNSRILIVSDASKLTNRQIAHAALVATYVEDGLFHLVKARRYPKGFHALSHFAEPITRRTLVRYISANLAD